MGVKDAKPSAPIMTTDVQRPLLEDEALPDQDNDGHIAEV